jgi:hypothetical protein
MGGWILAKLRAVFARRRPKLDLANPEMAAYQILQIIYSRATIVRPCIDLEIIKEQFSGAGGNRAQYEAGLALVLSRGWLSMEENGSCLKFTQAGIDEFV